MEHYTITWKYIVNKMKEKYGIKIDSDEKFSMRELNVYIESIWDDFFYEKYIKEMIDKNEKV